VTLDLAVLPDDVASPHRMIGELAAALDSERAQVSRHLRCKRLKLK